MNPADRNLEMDRSISRSDLLLGMGAFVASTFAIDEAHRAVRELL